MRLLLGLLATAVLGLPIAAQAQPIEGLYVSAKGGAVVPQSINADLATLPGDGVRLQDRIGWAVNGSIGYALGNGWRFEVEGDYLSNGIDKLSDAPVGLPGRGTQHSYGVMVNALYDFDIRSRYVFPYLGLGAGYMWTRLDNAGFAATRPGLALRFPDGAGARSGAFAWQAIAGLSFPVPHMPGLSFLTEYRFLDITAGEHFTATQTRPLTPTPVKTRFALGAQYSHSFMLGVRYAFHVTPPAPPPAPVLAAAPAPAPARSYLVFFDWDKATLTDRARGIIKEAAEASTHVQYTRIMVNGYTDTSGKPAYNQALSLRRASSVAAELVRDGVPRGAIAIHGFGETHLLVPTAPGVREPQNRRVEIVIEG